MYKMWKPFDVKMLTNRTHENTHAQPFITHMFEPNIQYPCFQCEF